jgi:hypothetical protein
MGHCWSSYAISGQSEPVWEHIVLARLAFTWLAAASSTGSTMQQLM